jgi:hypothetical protein
LRVTRIAGSARPGARTHGDRRQAHRRRARRPWPRARHRSPEPPPRSALQCGARPGVRDMHTLKHEALQRGEGCPFVGRTFEHSRYDRSAHRRRCASPRLLPSDAATHSPRSAPVRIGPCRSRSARTTSDFDALARRAHRARLCKARRYQGGAGGGVGSDNADSVALHPANVSCRRHRPDRHAEAEHRRHHRRLRSPHWTSPKVLRPADEARSPRVCQPAHRPAPQALASPELDRNSVLSAFERCVGSRSPVTSPLQDRTE